MYVELKYNWLYLVMYCLTCSDIGFASELQSFAGFVIFVQRKIYVSVGANSHYKWINDQQWINVTLRQKIERKKITKTRITRIPDLINVYLAMV